MRDFKIDMKKLIPYLLFISNLTLLVGCGNNEDAIMDTERKQEQKQITEKQTEKFANLSICLKQKKAEAGVNKDSKPTADMIKQCLSLIKQ